MLRTSYRRLTLVGQAIAERLTFDFDLMFTARGEHYTIQPGRVLVEAKTGAAGSAKAGPVLRSLGVRPVEPCSKYCLGVALAYAELPSNPFRPLIRGHFEAPRRLGPPVFDRGDGGVPPVPGVETPLGRSEGYATGT